MHSLIRALLENLALQWDFIMPYFNRRLRDKGEDDKMPPIRKRQRGLLLRLQQEQVICTGNQILLPVFGHPSPIIPKFLRWLLASVC